MLLHWGSAVESKTRVDRRAVPTGSYLEFLKPRLLQLAAARGQSRLKLDLTMVSDIDDDTTPVRFRTRAEEIENQERAGRNRTALAQQSRRLA